MKSGDISLGSAEEICGSEGQMLLLKMVAELGKV